MDTTTTLPADASAQRIVRHFQSEGFPGITEALIVRIRLKKGDQQEIDSAFDRALEREATPPVRDYFEIRPYGFFSEIRNFAAARSAFQGDLGLGLLRELPSVFFDAAPVVVDDALASGTKYDAMIKLGDNVGGYAVGILLNDPTATFFDYLGTHLGNDWQKIMGNFGSAASSLALDVDLI